MHLVIIDGLSFFFRAYHAVRPLSRADGLPTNALYGFAQMLLKVVKDLQPDQCVVALDSIGPTFRKDMYPAYKAHRSEPDEEMKAQLPYLQPMIEAFAIPALRVEGVEADDIIATLATEHGQKGDKVTIVSSDKDLMQLLGGTVTMLDTMKNKVFDVDAVVEKFGVGPEKVTQVQALIGDSSDNIPGVPGIGPKTGAQLIGEFGTLEVLYENLDQIKREKLRQNLRENKAEADLSLRLVTLKRDVNIPENQHTFDFNPDFKTAKTWLEDMEFNTLANRLASIPQTPHQMAINNEDEPKPSSMPATLQTPDYEMVTDEKRLDDILNEIKEIGLCAFDTETTSLDAIQAKIVGLSLAWGQPKESPQACYIPLAHTPPLGDLLSDDHHLPSQLDKKLVLNKLSALSQSGITLVAHNLKYDSEILLGEGLTFPPKYEDTLLMSFCLAGGMHGHGLDFLADKHFGHKMTPYKEVCGAGKSQITFDLVPLDKATHYAAEDADYTLRLYHLLAPQLATEGREKVRKLYETVERPLISVLAKMERTGVCINRTQLEKLSLAFADQMADLEKRIHTAAGVPFNLNSPKQMSEALFDQMGLTVKGKRPTSTNIKVLEALAEEEDEKARQTAEDVMAYRQISKLRSTYTEALIGQINPQTGRVHTSYNQAGAATGRFSSSDPNLQNIPIRTENGRKIRHAFVPTEGHIFLAADYSQVELRLLAHFSQAPALVKAFQEEQDIHAFTAHQIFDTPLNDVTSDQRRIAKTINFGLVYGMGASSLARQIGVSKPEATDYINRYFIRYDGIKDFLDTQIEFAQEKGYVETLMGRRVHLPDINSKHGGLRAGAERAAINAPLQGSNADIIKFIMPKIQARLQKDDFKTQMLLQVHDELVFDVPPLELEDVRPIIKQMMETAVTLSVPLQVGTGTGNNWEDAH